jgi:hypothetical protein
MIGGRATSSLPTSSNIDNTRPEKNDFSYDFPEQEITRHEAQDFAVAHTCHNIVK